MPPIYIVSRRSKTSTYTKPLPRIDSSEMSILDYKFLVSKNSSVSRIFLAEITESIDLVDLHHLDRSISSMDYVHRQQRTNLGPWISPREIYVKPD